jgi:hypothetical protein
LLEETKLLLLLLPLLLPLLLHALLHSCNLCGQVRHLRL